MGLAVNYSPRAGCLEALTLWEDAARLEQIFPGGVKEVLTGARVETGMNGQLEFHFFTCGCPVFSKQIY